MPLNYTYRVSRYPPELWNSAGRFMGEVLFGTAPGPVESAHLDAVELFARALRISQFEVREPQISGPEQNPDEAALPADHVLAELFGPHLPGFFDGAVVDIAGARRLVQMLLRGGEGWCLLEAKDRMFVHVFNQSVYVGCADPCSEAVAHVVSSGLFVALVPHSPVDPDDAANGFTWEALDAVDEQFWADIARLIHKWGPVMLAEQGAWRRWHRLTAASPRVLLRPRTRVSVYRDLPVLDMNGVLDGVPGPEGIGWLTWVRSDGSAVERCIQGDAIPDLDALLVDAVRAGWQPIFESESEPAYFEAVVADEDGVIRARWLA